MIILDLRHLGASNGWFVGEIDDARIYASALDQVTIASLQPNKLTGPSPLAWWSFENGSLADHVGSFPEGKLWGRAQVRNGRLCLTGEGDCMIVRRKPKIMRPENDWPIYHLTVLPDEGIAVPYDANGCIYWRGRYHLMYIFQRLDGAHCWGHASSPDLIHWTFHPPALEPHPGDPDTGIFSGNAFVNKDGVPMLCYMGVNAGVCLATALDNDLIRWEKHPHNPVIPIPKVGEPAHGVYTVWDPYLWLERHLHVSARREPPP
ncbi:MAG: glycoside hydrolase family 32 protein [Candidatus Zipacnadales bacterium]